MTNYEMIMNNLLPFLFFLLMGISVFAYVILDGYDLGIGIILPFFKSQEQDLLISSIGPFWDANETWLVLAVGLLLVAFPTAHGIILSSLYIPVLIMLASLILRGCSFEFRIKSNPKYKQFWTYTFFLSSLTTSLSQGFMLGFWIVSFETNFISLLFAFLISVCLVASYSLLGTTWSIFKNSNQTLSTSLSISYLTLFLFAIGVFLISISTPLISLRVFHLWFSTPNIFFLSIFPLLTLFLFFKIYTEIKLIKNQFLSNQFNHSNHYKPFLFTTFIFFLSFLGLAYSFFPYIIMDKLTIWQSASDNQSLLVIFFGAIIVIPIILIYTCFSYYIFKGKNKISYDH